MNTRGLRPWRPSLLFFPACTPGWDCVTLWEEYIHVGTLNIKLFWFFGVFFFDAHECMYVKYICLFSSLWRLFFQTKSISAATFLFFIFLQLPARTRFSFTAETQLMVSAVGILRLNFLKREIRKMCRYRWYSAVALALVAVSCDPLFEFKLQQTTFCFLFFNNLLNKGCQIKPRSPEMEGR